MITAEETRQRLRTGAAAARKRAPVRPAWCPPEVADIQVYIPVLAFDASLANTGWAVIEAGAGRVHVLAHGTIRPAAPDDGYMGTWRRAAELRLALLTDDAIRHYARDRSGGGRARVGVEAPLVGGGHRTESSLIAGLAVWQAFDDVAVVSATHVSAVLLGDPKIRSAERKKAIREAVIRLVPETAGRNWNEHERDSLSVGLTMLWDIKQGKVAGGGV
jgi:hypothetical protein